MPLMMSFTRVCEPKPMATPTTPAPAISGPIWTPSADSAISTAVTSSKTKSIAEDRQQGLEPRMAAPFLALLVGRRRRLDALAVDGRLGDLPAEVGEKHDDHGAEQAAQKPREYGIAGGQRHEVDMPFVGKKECTGDDEDRTQAPLQHDGQDGRNGGSRFGAARGL